MVAPPDNDVLWARGLHYAYQGSPALLGVSLGVRDGEILGIVGPRGSGKTTLLKCMSGQLTPEQGEVWFNSAPVHTLPAGARERLRRDRFGWVGSSPELVPELTARENAALPLLLCGIPHRSARDTAQEWLDRLDVGDCARRRPAELHQAQRQRVAVARALVSLPEVLFADDPTAPLHRPDAAQVLRTLTTAARTHRITVLLATSDPEVVAFTDRAVGLVDGVRSASLPKGPQPEGASCPASA
ncbi:ATP-binding cassette domain-containing protein [Streptomyces sp. RB6PN25]|uniref:ATP-binding cassette domain-containing protein n=1 Tax=Streptomyces humicola TaxID=2953240 RepID=A0ABT1Q2P9_9ACTN|nr:ATP-binding cassette domain-containing protein [Streptomyces humicola]MCQ4084159.1 ATP-binding cassette domain-containing protein [Streptomyces humicola]